MGTLIRARQLSMVDTYRYCILASPLGVAEVSSGRHTAPICVPVQQLVRPYTQLAISSMLQCKMQNENIDSPRREEHAGSSRNESLTVSRLQVLTIFRPANQRRLSSSVISAKKEAVSNAPVHMGHVGRVS